MPAKYQRGVISADDLRLTRTAHFSDGLVSTTEMKWSDVRRVVAFKRDVLSYDLLCLGFETEAGLIEVDEETDGWETVIASLPKYLPGSRTIEGCWTELVKPAFATNLTQIFPSQ